MDTLVAPPGMKGLVVADTAIGDVRGEEGYYHYRGRSAVEVARTSTFEEAWALVLDGPGDVDGPVPPVRPDRVLRPSDDLLVAAVGDAAGPTNTPLDVLRAVLPYTGAYHPTLDISPEARRVDAVRVASIVPVVVTAAYRRANGLEPIAPDPAASHAADYLHMLSGTVPTAAQARAIEAYLVATIDHGFNASTFTARVIASTGSDVASAVIGALGAFVGPLHGGAPGRVLDMLDAIGDPSNAKPWVRAELARGGKIMGFGHAVYRTEDPRSRLLLEMARGFDDPLVARAEAIEAEILGALREHKPGTPIQTNVEYYAAIVLHLCGIPPVMFTPTFAVARVVGWTAHVLEQAANGKILRPASRYVGPMPAV